jgi:hypothetical protein
MDVAYLEVEAVYGLIHGLPSSSSWESFKQLLIQTVQHYNDTTEPSKRVVDELYGRISQRIVAECLHLDLLLLKPLKDRPSLDYAGVANEIQKHVKNPHGIRCTNCGGTSHDKEHCWSQGGGCEGQGLSGKRSSRHRSKDSVSSTAGTLEAAALAASLAVPGGDGPICLVLPLGLMVHSRQLALQSSIRAQHLTSSRIVASSGPTTRRVQALSEQRTTAHFRLVPVVTAWLSSRSMVGQAISAFVVAFIPPVPSSTSYPSAR